MGHIRVHGADLDNGQIKALRVKMHGLPPRTIDRDTAVSWMRDGHSLIPVVKGAPCPALQLVEIAEGDQSAHFVRADNAAEASDALPELPGVEEARA